MVCTVQGLPLEFEFSKVESKKQAKIEGGNISTCHVDCAGIFTEARRERLSRDP